MRKKYLITFLIALVATVYFLGTVVFAEDADVYLTVLPGNFYFTVYGELQTGIDLDGLGPPGDTAQTGYWNATDGVDYLRFYDASTAPGFRLLMSLDGDFIYSGTYIEQSDIPASDFSVYADWESGSGKAPSIGSDDLTKTFSIDTMRSCAAAVPGAYSFNSQFSISDYSVSFSTDSFNYFSSSVGCFNEGTLNLGRFELDMGFPNPGTYRSSLYMIMVDGQ